LVVEFYVNEIHSWKILL